jgi:hypothetical protein
MANSAVKNMLEEIHIMKSRVSGGRAALTNVAEDILRVAKELTPVRTGRTQAGWYYKISAPGDIWRIRLSNPRKKILYWLEWGTPPHTAKDDSKPMVWEGDKEYPGFWRVWQVRGIEPIAILSRVREYGIARVQEEMAKFIRKRSLVRNKKFYTKMYV